MRKVTSDTQSFYLNFTTSQLNGKNASISHWEHELSCFLILPSDTQQSCTYSSMKSKNWIRVAIFRHNHGFSSLTPSDHRISLWHRSSLLQIWGWWRPVQHSRGSPRQRCSLLVAKPPMLNQLTPSAPGPPLGRWRSRSRWCYLRRGGRRYKIRNTELWMLTPGENEVSI